LAAAQLPHDLGALCGAQPAQVQVQVLPALLDSGRLRDAGASGGLLRGVAGVPVGVVPAALRAAVKGAAVHSGLFTRSWCEA